MDRLLPRSWWHGFGHVGDAVTPTPKYIEVLKRRVWEIHIRDHDKHIRREDLNAVLAAVDYALDYYGKKVAEFEAINASAPDLLAALKLAKDHSELEDEILDIVDAAIAKAEGGAA